MGARGPRRQAGRLRAAQGQGDDAVGGDLHLADDEIGLVLGTIVLVVVTLPRPPIGARFPTVIVWIRTIALTPAARQVRPGAEAVVRTRTRLPRCEPCSSSTIICASRASWGTASLSEGIRSRPTRSSPRRASTPRRRHRVPRSAQFRGRGRPRRVLVGLRRQLLQLAVARAPTAPRRARRPDPGARCLLRRTAVGGRARRLGRPVCASRDRLVRRGVRRRLVPGGRWFQWHYDRWELPGGASEIACNPRASQAFVLDRNLAVQFHPETDEPILCGWLDNGGDDEARKVRPRPGRAARRHPPEHGRQPAPRSPAGRRVPASGGILLSGRADE